MTEPQLKERFDRLDFGEEPRMTQRVADYVDLGQKRVRRNRLAMVAGVGAGTVAVAAGIVAVVPGEDVSSVTRDPGFATAPKTAGVEEAPPLPDVPEDVLEFTATRELLLEVATEHLDPDREHLPSETTNFNGGGDGDNMLVGTKLSWTNPGEDGEGMVWVGVTTPGYTDDPDYRHGIGVEISSQDYTQEVLPGTDVKGWVSTGSESGTEYPDLESGMYVERADGSVVGVKVHRLFGNNSDVPVSDVAVDLESLAAFVTDPRIDVAAEHGEARQMWEKYVDWLLQQDEAEQKEIIKRLSAERPMLEMELGGLVDTQKLVDWGVIELGADYSGPLSE